MGYDAEKVVNFLSSINFFEEYVKNYPYNNVEGIKKDLDKTPKIQLANEIIYILNNNYLRKKCSEELLDKLREFFNCKEVSSNLVLEVAHHHGVSHLSKKFSETVKNLGSDLDYGLATFIHDLLPELNAKDNAYTRYKEKEKTLTLE